MDSKQENLIKDLNILVLPLAALGDLTVYLRLAWLFSNAGARVTLVSDLLYTAKTCFPWLNIEKESCKVDYRKNCSEYDLVIACYEKYFDSTALDYKNIAFVTAKKISKKANIDGRSVEVKGMIYNGATRPFCLNSDAGITSVQWVDRYVFDVYGIKSSPQPLPIIKDVALSGNKILIFPTTPHKQKNYWLSGFLLIANKLKSNGWDIEFVCMPSEESELKRKIKKFPVVSYASIEMLISRVYSSSVVISNDSGGGHLGSLCGVKTFTFTRRDKFFTWRPGFSGENQVISPVFRFKVLGNYIWRPFVPFLKVCNEIGKYKEDTKPQASSIKYRL